MKFGGDVSCNTFYAGFPLMMGVHGGAPPHPMVFLKTPPIKTHAPPQLKNEAPLPNWKTIPPIEKMKPPSRK